jgi:hypothetical protein
MKWRHGKNSSLLRLQRWHRWFAWYPITVDGDKYWLEFVYRKASIRFTILDDYPCYNWEFSKTMEAQRGGDR